MQPMKSGFFLIHSSLKAGKTKEIRTKEEHGKTYFLIPRGKEKTKRLPNLPSLST
jgi:hypothetical protein